MPTARAAVRRLALLVAATLAGVLAFAPASPAAPSGAAGATFGLGPATARGIDGRPYLTYLTAPGAVLDDHVALVNLDNKPVTLNLYAVDATVSSDGKFGYLARDAARRDASTWIRLGAETSATVTLAPRSTKVVPVEIHVPSGAEPGDHAAGVIASLTSKITDNEGKRIDFEQRVALRAFFRLSGALHPQLAIQDLRASYHGTLNPFAGGDVTLTYTVRNLGNVRLGAHQKVTVNGLLDNAVAIPALPDLPLLLPGTAVSMHATVHGVLPQGRLTARVQLFPLTVAGDVDPGLPASFSGTTRLWAVPWPLLAVLVAAAGSVAGLLVWRRRRRARAANGRHRATPALTTT